MKKKLSSKELLFVKNLFLTTVLGAIIGILNYLFNIFIARYTDQNIFSIFSSTLGITYLIQIPAVAIQALITKGVAQNKEKNLNRYKWQSLFVFTLLGILFSVLFFLNKKLVSDVASIPPETIFFLSLSFLFAFISPIAKGLLLGLEKIVTVNMVLLAETILRFVIGAIAIKMGGSLSLLILASSVPAMLSTIIVLPLIKFDKSKTEELKINFKEFLLITISFLLLTFPFTIDLILVNPSFRAEYATISLLGKLVYFASITTSSVLFARLSNEKEDKDQKRSLSISLALASFIGLFLSSIFFIFSDYIVTLTVGDQYLAISKYLGVFGLCMTGFAFVYMVANFFISRGSFSYLYILFFTTVLQVAFFLTRNDSLDMVIQNQIVVYIFLISGTLMYLLINFKSIKNGEEEYKGKG